MLKRRLLGAIGPKYAARLESAEPLATLWCETLLDEEIEFMTRTAAISHAIIAETFSAKVITPGYTTIDDLGFHYWQRVADLGLDISFYRSFVIRGRHPRDIERYGKDDRVIRPGDLVHCDVGPKYMHYTCDHQELIAQAARQGIFVTYLDRHGQLFHGDMRARAVQRSR